MGIIDDLLQKTGLKFDDLTAAERETLMSWVKAMDTNVLTVDIVRGYVASLRDSVENELVKIGHNSKEDIFLKARLRNLMLLEAFLSTPEKARQVINQRLASFGASKK